jgi:hypothetical protein
MRVSYGRRSLSWLGFQNLSHAVQPTVLNEIDDVPTESPDVMICKLDKNG